MKWTGSLLVLLMALLTVAEGQDLPDPDINAEDDGQVVKLSCTDGHWLKNDTYTDGDKWELIYEDASSKEYKCKSTKKEKTVTVLVKIRTCDNCIEADASTLAGIIVGDVVATVLIGVAVYFIASHPQGKVYRGSKASDRQNLIPNQPNDSTYQVLSPGRSDEYSQLDRRGKR